GIGSAQALRGSVKGATGSANVLFVPVESIDVGTARSGPLRVAAHDVDLAQGAGLLGRAFLDQFTVTIDSTARTPTIPPKYPDPPGRLFPAVGTFPAVSASPSMTPAGQSGSLRSSCGGGFLALNAHRCYVSASMDYKDTLNLPKTSFPMKANLP